MGILMSTMKTIDHTLNEKEMLQFCNGLIWAYENEGNPIPPYFGKVLQVSDNNSKSGYGTVNMPSLVTCLIGLNCNKVCYACVGYFRMDHVELPRISNLVLWLTGPESYINQLRVQMLQRRIVRINDSGDLPSYEYAEMLYNLSIETGCNLHIFTKKHHLINKLCKAYNETAASLESKGIIILFSADPKIVNFVNPYGFKVADIVEDSENLYNGNLIGKTHVCKHGNCTECMIHKTGCFANLATVETVALAIHTTSKARTNEYFSA